MRCPLVRYRTEALGRPAAINVCYRTDRHRAPGYATSMNVQTIMVPIFAAAILASGCASTDPRYSSSHYRSASGYSNENYYAVINSIEASPPAGGATLVHELVKPNGQHDVYFIRVRFDDRSYQTVTQIGLDGLRVGDSVRIEHDRVRRY